MVRLTSMQALVAFQYGPPEAHTIAELPIPEPGPGQIQVRIAAVSLNPADVRLAAGDFRGAVDLPFPHVPGNDFAGTVSAVGESVTRFEPGDEIFGFATPRALRHMGSSSLSTGALAEYAVFEAETPFLARRPAALDVEQAAALPTVGLTARALMASAEVRPGMKVLVVGATGGVGTAVLPLLAAAGAHVVATARDAGAAAGNAAEPGARVVAAARDAGAEAGSRLAEAGAHVVAAGRDAGAVAGSAGDADLVRSLGAAEAVGYDDYPDGVDLALNLVLPGDRLDRLVAAVRPGGTLLSITFPPPAAHDDVDVRLVLDMEARHGGMAEVAADALAGRLRARIAARYEFADAVRALTHFATGHKTGKLLVRVGSGT
ncbi:NADP-dependent oxidoreductase [Dactylosporangium sp. CA-139066]|uniref:NADP-dependent oxidoreductase n=1 Tax=Dactylosporangium sp. CA-139066 TaxID=3239930 RepID=UPI003D8A626B